MSKTEKTSIEFSDLNVTLSLDTDNFPEELKTPLSQTYDPESSYAMSGVAIGEALKPVYDKISTVLGGVDQTYSPRSASAQSGIAVKQAIDDVENRIKEFDNALEGCNDAVIMAREAANRAAASSISAQKSASTAVFAKSDLETARDTAVSAATTATDAASAASSVKSYLETARDTAVSAAATATNAAAAAATSETNATTAATTATQQAEAAAASATQADTDARACAIYDQRVSANAATATEAATTATEAATTATEAAATATEAAAQAAQADYQYAETLYVATKNYPDGVTYGASQADGTYKYAIVKNVSGVTLSKTPIIIVHGDCSFSCEHKTVKVFYSDDAVRTADAVGYCGCWAPGDAYLHAPNIEKAYRFDQSAGKCYLVMSPATKFEKLTQAEAMFSNHNGSVTFADGTTFSALVNGRYMFEDSHFPDCLPDTVTFESVRNAQDMFRNCQFTKLPKSMNLSKCATCNNGTFLCYKMEIDDIIRVCLTLPDLTALDTPKTSPLGIANKCMHKGAAVANTNAWLNENYPDFILTLNARGWSVTFA